MASTTKTPYEIILRPIVTEKSHRGTDPETNPAPQYTFAVAPGANKYEIAWALEQIQKEAKNIINVVAVNTVNVRAKARTGRFMRRANRGKSSAWKKAILTLKPGQQIEVVEGV